MNRREFLKSSTAAVAAAGFAARHLQADPAKGKEPMSESNRPNILMITCHDLGQHLGCYGVKTVQSPNLDALAARGLRFANFYSTSAVCSPGRASLHTGRYPQSNGLMGLTHAPWWWHLHDDERTIAQELKDLGYATTLIGFTHIHNDAKRLGYDRRLSNKCHAPASVSAARELIAAARPGDKPFFVKVGFTEVHRRFTHGADETNGVFVPPWLQSTKQVRDDLAAYQATIQYFDERVGEILDALADSKVADNTLVIMTSDHGIPYPGAKWSARKAGLEVPLILHQPGTVFTGGKVRREIMSNLDVLPTLLDYLGAKIPERVQGVSFLGLLTGKSAEPPRREAFGQYTPDMKRDNLSRCIITDRYQLIRYFDQGRSVAYPVDVNPQMVANHEQRCKTKGTRPFAQLYDLHADPYELHDIGSKPENAKIVEDLSRRLLAWMKRVNDPLLQGPLRTPYYDRAIADLKKVDESE